MNRHSCSKAQGLLEAGLERLTPDERAALDIHLAACDTCRAQQRTWERITDIARHAPLHPPSDELVAQVVAAAAAPPGSRPRTPAPRRPGAVGGALALVAVVMLAVGSAWWWGEPGGTGGAPFAEPAPEPVPLATTGSSSTAPAAPVTATERLMLPGATGGTGLWLERGAVVQPLHNDEDLARYRLERGRIVAEVGPNEPGFRFVVETPRARVTAWGTVFAVELLADGRERVRLSEGVVEVRSRHDAWEPVILQAGTELVVGDPDPHESEPAALAADLAFIGRAPPAPSLPEPPPPVPALATDTAQPVQAPATVAVAPATTTSDEVDAAARSRAATERLVQQARRHQLAREFEAACAAYEELIRTYPHSSAVGTSHIALGQLKLEPLDRPAEALTHFEAYLARHPGGLLAEEASLGRIRALVRQGRHEAVIRAATGYLQQFPGSPASPEVLWVRAESLQATGDHSRAEDDHRELVSRWPDTPAARLAAQLLDPWTESP